MANSNIYTEDDPRMHELYALAQGGQIILPELQKLTDDELIYIAGHDITAYFELDARTKADRIEQRDRRSKLNHNSIRARLVLEQRWVERRDDANRSILAESVKIAAKTRDLTGWLAYATIALAIATFVLAIRG